MNLKSINSTSSMIKNWNNFLSNSSPSKSSLKNANNSFNIQNNKMTSLEEPTLSLKLKSKKFRKLNFTKRNTDKKQLKTWHFLQEQSDRIRKWRKGLDKNQ